MNRTRSLAVSGVLAGFLSAAATADTPTLQQDPFAVWFNDASDLSGARLVIRTPDGDVTSVTADNGSPIWELPVEFVQDGLYRYELRGGKPLDAAGASQLTASPRENNGRDWSAVTVELAPVYSSGSFLVRDGVIVHPDDLASDALSEEVRP